MTAPTAIPVYTYRMTKVMISFPDELLRRLDGRAKELEMTRSGLLQQLAEKELVGGEMQRNRARAEARRQTKDRGGDTAALVREQRRAR